MNKRYRFSNGYSLIELLIGLLLGTFLITGMVEIFSGLSRSFQLRDSISRIQEDGRFAIEVMARELRHTGYRAFPRTGSVTGIFRQNLDAFTNNDDLGWGAMIMGVDGLPDSFVVRFQIESAGDLTDSLCRPDVATVSAALALGGLSYTSNNVNVVLSEKFYLNGNILYCDSRVDYNNAAGVAQIPILGIARALVSNVENMRVLYGLDTDPLPVVANGVTPPPPCDPFYSNNVSYQPANANYQANQYVDAATVNAFVLVDAPNGRTVQDRDIAGNCVTRSPWSAIKSVRISLIMRSERDKVADQDTPSVTVNGGKVIAIASADQKRIFQVFSSTVMLRNVIFN